MTRKLIAFVAAAALASGTLVSTVLAEESPQGTMQQTAGQMSGEDQTTSRNPDLAFAAVIVSRARLATEISDLVAKKATNPQIKQLAEQVSKDRQQCSERVQAAAKKAGITLHEERMLPRDQAIYNHMQQLPAESLQRAYVFFLAGDNQTALLYSQWAAKNAQKPEIKQVAQEVAQKLEERHQEIQKIAQAEVSGGMQPGGEATPTGGGSNR